MVYGRDLTSKLSSSDSTVINFTVYNDNQTDDPTSHRILNTVFTDNILYTEKVFQVSNLVTTELTENSVRILPSSGIQVHQDFVT